MPRKAIKCSYNNCNNIHKAGKEGGLCREHYLLETKNKNYTKKTKHGRPKNETLCKVKKCNKGYYCLDYCRAHYLKFKKYGDPLKIVHKTIHVDTCAVLGCPNQYFLKDYCEKHYWRNQRYGSPNVVKKNLEHSGKCDIKDCKNEYYAKNWCKNHYMIYEYARSGTTGDLALWIAMNNVRERDSNTCRWFGCGKSVKLHHVEIHVHHIFPQSEYPELKYEEKYMICYCKFHHAYWHEMRGDLQIANMIAN